VAQGIAVHWALKRDGVRAPGGGAAAIAAVRRSVYEAAGASLKKLSFTASAALAVRAQAAAQDAEDFAQGRVSEPASKKGDFVHGLPSNVVRAAARSSALPTPSPTLSSKSAAAQKKAETTRATSAALLAKSLSKGEGGEGRGDDYSVADILEMRAGLMPFSLFPTDAINTLATSEECLADCWFTVSFSFSFSCGVLFPVTPPFF